jgi:hypothetical protein
MKKFNMTTGEKILSLACGQGRIEEALLKDVKTIDYVDISPKYMATVKKKIENKKLPPGKTMTVGLKELTLIRGRFYNHMLANICFGYLDDEEVEVLLKKLNGNLINYILVKENVLDTSKQYTTPENY